MEVVIERTPHGLFRAYDADTYDGAPDAEWPSRCVGIGKTEAEARADLAEQLNGQPRTLADVVRPWLPVMGGTSGGN